MKQDDYLCDLVSSTTPDPELVRLEAILSPFAFCRIGEGLPPGLARLPRPIPQVSGSRSRRLALAAGTLLLTCAAFLAVRSLSPGRSREPDSAPGASVPECSPPWASDEAHAESPPGEGSRMVLQSGSLAVSVPVAFPPLAIETTAGTARCLAGCILILVLEAGGGEALLRVERGLAAFESGARRVLVPARGACKGRSGEGPGTPYWQDANPGLILAVDAFDRGGPVEPVLEAAGMEDTLTWWHLLIHPDRRIRSVVYERLVRVYGAPDGVDVDSILALESAGLRVWRERLSLAW